MPDVATGDIITAAYLRALTNAGSVSTGAVDPSAVTTNSLTYTTAGGTIVGTPFVAPPSGLVMILWEASFNTAGSTGCLVSFEVRQGSTVGSGTVVTAADDNRALDTRVSTSMRPANFWRQTGLTPGNSYNVRMIHRSLTGSNSQILRRELTVLPIQ